MYIVRGENMVAQLGTKKLRWEGGMADVAQKVGGGKRVGGRGGRREVGRRRGGGECRGPGKRNRSMGSGRVKWWEGKKGFGVIEPEDGSRDAFVHISSVERAGLSTLREGQKVSYELQPGKNGKASAENLAVID